MKQNKTKNKIIKLENERKKRRDEKPTRTTFSLKERNELIVKYKHIIENVAKKISRRLPAHIEQGDLITHGMIGLIDALERYDASRDNKFQTYAEFRVRGAILDALRSEDWVPRSIRDKSKLLMKQSEKLENVFGRKPEGHEVAKSLSIDMQEYHNLVDNARPANLISFDEMAFFNGVDKSSFGKILELSKSLSHRVNENSIKKFIVKTIQELPERQRIVLSLSYYEGCNLRKIGQVLCVTESRVSQLHVRAIERLKEKLLPKLKEEYLEAS